MPFFIDVFHGFYRTAIVPTFIDIVPFLINIVPTNNLFLFVNRGSHFLTLMLEFLPKRERDDPQMCASAAYILVWADRWKVQFSAILNDNWIDFKIESVCQHSEHLNVTFWFMMILLVLDLLAKFCQISEKNLNFWHSY